MASTMDKRWAAPTRKSGMTVLGKIPKPVNLPSQRLENHGLDPNVEIVPKGTLTWGSKPAPTTPNAWGSSSLLSPKKDGSSVGPSHFNSRPSSGGGSRPSTAGSESLDSPNAWGPNSRPSSASGTLPSQHLPVVTNRPRSAETRPGSSQLSRFADIPSENLKASVRTIEKSGSPLHGHGFTLSTGDFPTLGAEKSSESNSQRGHSSKGRPTSSSGKDEAQNEQGKSLTAGSAEVIQLPNNQPVDIMKTEQHAYDGGPFAATGLPNEAQRPQQYPPNYYMPPPQFDSWRAPPGHPPEGMWHRGPAPGTPYRPVTPPASFPVEPFGYYGQFPLNSEAAAQQASGHGGYQPKNGDAYHSMPPNSYVMNHPVIPVRPAYQAQMTYDGHYGPQRANFNNVNARDSSFTGAPNQPGILNQFPDHNDKFQPGHSQSRPVKHEATPRVQLESERVHVVRREPRNFHDTHELLGGSREVVRQIQPAPPLLPHPDGNRTDMNTRVDTKGTYSEKNIVHMKSVSDKRGPAGTSHSSVFENAHSHPRETDDGTPQKKFKESNAVTLDQQPVIKKNAALIEKIGSLNNKVRNVDARNVVEPFSSKEAKEKQQKRTDSKADQKLPNVLTHGVEGVGPLYSHSTDASKAVKLQESIHDRAHRRDDSSRHSHHGPTKDLPIYNFAGPEWGENSAAESSGIELPTNQHDQPPEHTSQAPPVSVADDDIQRAKMRELAIQRAKQLQAEEEERTKQQRTKALAKLEELNRRSSVHQKISNNPPPGINDAHQKAGLDATARPAAESCNLTASDNLNTLKPPNNPKDTPVLLKSESTTVPHVADAGKVRVVHNILSSDRTTQTNMVEHVAQQSLSQSHDTSVAKPRQGYRRRHAVSEEKIPGEKSSVAVSTENVKKIVEASLDPATAVATLNDDPPAHNKKSARNSRGKKKVDDAPATSKYVSTVHNKQSTVNVSGEPKTEIVNASTEPKAQTAGVIISRSILPTEGTMVTVGSITVGGISFGSLTKECVESSGDAHNAANSRPRPQQAKRLGKNQHAVRPVEKSHGNEGVVWTPVKSAGQSEQSEEAMTKTAVAAPAQSVGKNPNDGENATRTKRAEMERYVPKPLSKEHQQQNSDQNLSSEKSSVENKSNDKGAAEKNTGAKADSTTVPKKWEDKKTSKGHGKSHSSWRRRNTDESASMVPNPAEQTENFQESHKLQKPSDQHQPFDKQADCAAENSSARTQTVPLPVSAPKEHGAANRQRRQNVKPPRNEGSNYSQENKDTEGRKDVNQLSTPGMDSNSSEHRNMSRSEVKSSGAPRAHWKPKSSNPQNNSQGNNTMEAQVDSATLHDSSNSNINLAQSSCENDEKDAQKELGRGDMVHGDGNQKSESQENTGHQQLNPAPRRQGQHNGRYHRGSGTHRGRGYDAGKPSHGANVERRRGGTHLEYQPVGSYNKPADFQQNPSVDERTVGPPAPGAVYRERGHNRAPRPAAHFVKRNPFSAPASNVHQDE